MTAEGVYLAGLLKAVVGQVVVYDVTGTLQVPTFAICLDEKVVAYSTHWDVAQALGLGLEEALQHYQSEHFQEGEYALVPVSDFPAALRSEQCSVPRYPAPDVWSERQKWLLQKLQANGLRAFAVPLDHDPALVEMLPFIVRVLLGKSELSKGE